MVYIMFIFLPLISLPSCSRLLIGNGRRSSHYHLCCFIFLHTAVPTLLVFLLSVHSIEGTQKLINHNRNFDYYRKVFKVFNYLDNLKLIDLLELAFLVVEALFIVIIEESHLQCLGNNFWRIKSLLNHRKAAAPTY